MDEQLNYAPCGYLSLSDDGTIRTINQTLLSLLGYDLYELQGKHVNTILPVSSRSFYQLYFFPMIKLQEQVEEMYLTFKSKTNNDIPILLNALRKKRNGEIVNDCVLFQIKNRYEYEQSLLTVKKETEKRNRVKSEQIAELDLLRRELESKQKELLEVNAQLQKLASTDGLTGLKNRRSLQEDLTSNISLSTRLSQPLSLLLLDIDHFKRINDTFGHLTGDKILQELGVLLTEESRKDDISARYGGEEFAMILPNTNQADAIKIAERIRLRIESEGWTNQTITISIGIATLTLGDTVDTFQSRADQALYSSKNRGRNRVTHACCIE
ncbi:sensor domain-containing diguanylate cyclase [Sporosarcina sp. FSL K6-5500]|uniref:sensor domain-containing diguanylate cyclase n=1 Tax=Sporosarcina sp. FSL K6-5500 TaxID=2921558 RepID=UPI0030F8A127